MANQAVLDKWMFRAEVLSTLGISNAALILLGRDKVLEPDCVECGRMWWSRTEVIERRDEIRAYLEDTYGTASGSLIEYA